MKQSNNPLIFKAVEILPHPQVDPLGDPKACPVAQQWLPLCPYWIIMDQISPSHQVQKCHNFPSLCPTIRNPNLEPTTESCRLSKVCSSPWELCLPMFSSPVSTSTSSKGRHVFLQCYCLCCKTSTWLEQHMIDYHWLSQLIDGQIPLRMTTLNQIIILIIYWLSYWL